MKFSEDKPMNVDDFTGAEQATRSPLVITCTEAQRRTRMWFWARWVTSANKAGAWSDMY
jgi:hypothetical protein